MSSLASSEVIAPDNRSNTSKGISEKAKDRLENASDKESRQVLRSMEYQYHGPIPLPNVLQGYEKVCPGSAQQIIDWTDREQLNRHKVQNKMIDTEARDSLLGIIGAIIVSTLLIVGGIVVILSLRTVDGTIVGGLIDAGGVAMVVGTFLRGTGTSWRDKDNLSNDDSCGNDNSQ